MGLTHNFNYTFTKNGAHPTVPCQFNYSYFDPVQVSVTSLIAANNIRNGSIPFNILAEFINYKVKAYMPRAELFQINNGTTLPMYLYSLLEPIAPSTLLILGSLHLFEKLCVSNRINLTYSDPKLVLTGCLMYTYKIIEDSPIFTRTWSRLSGYDIKTLNLVETRILEILNYSFDIDTTLFRTLHERALTFYKGLIGLNTNTKVTTPTIPRAHPRLHTVSKSNRINSHIDQNIPYAKPNRTYPTKYVEPILYQYNSSCLDQTYVTPIFSSETYSTY